MFSAFLVVCACCRNKVLQIETRKGGRGASSFSFPFSFPLLEYWFGTSEDKKDFKVRIFCCCLNEYLNQCQVCRSLWCHSAPWRWDGTARPPQPRPPYLAFLAALRQGEREIFEHSQDLRCSEPGWEEKSARITP